MKKPYIVWFDEIEKGDIGIVGGKGANLGEMFHAGFPIPYGFVLTAQSYFYIIEENNLRKEIKNYLTLINFDNPKELHDGSEAIRRLIGAAQIPHDLHKAISGYYRRLAAREAKFYKQGFGSQVLKHLSASYTDPLVAVRSSATAEDLPEASFAGQQETFLNVKGEHDLVDHVKNCWASLFTERAVYYRHHNNFDHMKVGLAVVVQRMVQSQQSGIAFSLDPVTNDKTVITIEAIDGLGEYIVGGKVTPDHYEVSKKDFSIVKKEIKKQQVKLIKRNGQNKEVALTAAQSAKQKISDSQIVELAKVIAAVENHYYFPQDIEWAIEGGLIYIVQSRPITTIHDTHTEAKAIISNTLLVTGSPASPGIGSGKPVIIMSPDEINKIKEGDILVAPMTDPDYVPAMKRAAGIITELGGRTSHAAIVSRELGVPAVVGAEGATKLLRKEDLVSVNGSTGEIFRGKLQSSHMSHGKKVQDAHKHVKTLTKIYINLAQVDEAEKASKMDVDGIGLLRAEFMIADIGLHPKYIIKQKKQQFFIDTLAKQLTRVVKPFAPRPVVYRTTDFKSNEYRHLKGGEEFEPHEENPMLGFRGASRYITWRDVFDMEIEAIKKVRAAGYKNLHVMIPFLRTPFELMQVKSILNEHGLLNQSSFKLWMMVEVPSAVILLEDFLKLGVDGISIGTNDLTMLLLGVDRDSHEVAHIYSETNPAVMWALEKIVKTARKHNVTVSVCGQAPSDYPEITQKLIEWGATSVSLNMDAVERTKLLVHDVEKKLWHTLQK